MLCCPPPCQTLTLVVVNGLAVLPQILPFTFGKEFTNSGDLVMVSCVVQKGDTPLTVEWLFQEQPIDHFGGSDFLIAHPSDRVSTLTISSVQASNAGEYACKATNPAGSSNFTAQLKINGKTAQILLNVLPMFLYPESLLPRHAIPS
jgi:hypothetical protein